MAVGRKTGGRKPGSRNKTTTAAKEAIALAAEGLGGTERLIEWAKEDPANESAFWTRVYPRLVPLDANISGRVTIEKAVVDFID